MGSGSWAGRVGIWSCRKVEIVFPWQLFNINSFLPDYGANDILISPGLLPPVAKAFRCWLFFMLLHRSGQCWPHMQVPFCSGETQCCRSCGGKSHVSSSLASGSLGWRFGGWAPAPPKKFNLPLLWLHRNGTDFLPTPAAWVGAGGCYWVLGPVALEGCRAWRDPWCCTSGWQPADASSSIQHVQSGRCLSLGRALVFPVCAQ